MASKFGYFPSKLYNLCDRSEASEIAVPSFLAETRAEPSYLLDRTSPNFTFQSDPQPSSTISDVEHLPWSNADQNHAPYLQPKRSILDQPIIISPEKLMKLRALIDHLQSIYEEANGNLRKNMRNNQNRPAPTLCTPFSTRIPSPTISDESSRWSNSSKSRGSNSKSSTRKQGFCAFCHQNGEEAVNHLLKDHQGRVICPVLSKFVCKLCHATGHNAHTQKFCPKNPMTKGDPVKAGVPPGLLPDYLTFKKPCEVKANRH